MPRSRKFIINASANTKIAYQAHAGLGHGSDEASLPSTSDIISIAIMPPEGALTAPVRSTIPVRMPCTTPPLANSKSLAHALERYRALRPTCTQEQQLRK